MTETGDTLRLSALTHVSEAVTRVLPLLQVARARHLGDAEESQTRPPAPPWRHDVMIGASQHPGHHDHLD